MRIGQKGFTLIEVIIVIAIVGLLAAVAVPTYQSYITRAKISELLLAASSCRNSITEKVQSSSSSNISDVIKNSCAPSTTKNIKSIIISLNGVITILAYENELKPLTNTTNTLTLVPIQTGTTPLVGTTDGGKTIAGWRCGSTADGTTIPAKYLPSSCKGAY